MLEAAHIQPYLEPAFNHVQNGLVLRAHLHRLCDTDHITFTPKLRPGAAAAMERHWRSDRPAGDGVVGRYHRRSETS
jgi:hypothetical protein